MSANERLENATHPLLGGLVAVAVGLGLIHGVGYLLVGSGPLLPALPWYVPMMHTFVALAALCIAVLALGRYSVLHEPATFWLGLAFVGFVAFAISVCGAGTVA